MPFKSQFDLFALNKEQLGYSYIDKKGPVQFFNFKITH